MGAKRETLTNSCTRLKEESGIAFILVLGVVSLFAVLVTMQITTSKISAVSSKVNTDRSKTKFAAESAAAFAQWMLIVDNFANTIQDTSSEEELEKIWRADGRPRTLEMEDGSIASIKVTNAIGSNVDDINQLKSQRTQIINQRAGDNEVLREQLEEFFAVFEDYTDGDDLLRHPEFGMEKDDYESEGLENFPRNANMQFREEIYWIKNVEHYKNDLLSEFRRNTALPENLFQILPPPGINAPGNSGGRRTNFYSETPDSLASKIENSLASKIVDGLDESERQIIQECQNEVFVDVATTRECLGLELTAKLNGIRGGINYNPDAIVYTIDVTASSPNREITRRLVSSINLRDLPRQSGRSDVGGVTPLVYWQKISY